MHKLYSKDTLDIRSIKHLGYRLGFPPALLREVAKKAEKLYVFREKTKENGKVRRISEPKETLKKIQKAINRLLQEISVPGCAHGSIKGRSNLTNAAIHSGSGWLLSLDFKDFFPNISHYQVFNLFKHQLNCTGKVASVLTRLCTVRKQVPQGGPVAVNNYWTPNKTFLRSPLH